jgi:hypothetical protein
MQQYTRQLSNNGGNQTTGQDAAVYKDDKEAVMAVLQPVRVPWHLV